MKRNIRAGMTGWDNGSAYKVLKSFSSKFGKVFLLEMAHSEPGSRKVLRWLEAVTEKGFKTWDSNVDGKMEPPPDKIFKKGGILRK